MLTFTLAISCLTTSNLPWFMDLTFQVPMAILLFPALDLASITSHIHNWVLFFLWLHLFILSWVISLLISSSMLGTYWPGEFLFQYPIILPFHTVHGASRQEYWSGLPFPSPVGHILSDLSNMTHSSWVAPRAWLSFTELENAGFRKGRGTRDQIASIHWIMEKAREFQKNIYFCFIDYAKTFVWITINWKILKEMGIPDHLTCLLRNLYAGHEATVRTGHGTTD